MGFIQNLYLTFILLSVLKLTSLKMLSEVSSFYDEVLRYFLVNDQRRVKGFNLRSTDNIYVYIIFKRLYLRNPFIMIDHSNANPLLIGESLKWYLTFEVLIVFRDRIGDIQNISFVID